MVGNHFLYRHSVDDHNNKQHSPISLEVVWGTKYWPNHVFSFLLAVTEVNVNLAAQYFGGMKQVGQIEFRKLLAKTLIFNSYCDDETDNTPEKKQKQHGSGHCLIMLDTIPTKNGRELGEKWVSELRTKFMRPNWMRMLSCAYTTQLLHSTVEVCWNNKDSYFIWFKFVC